MSERNARRIHALIVAAVAMLMIHGVDPWWVKAAIAAVWSTVICQWWLKPYCPECERDFLFEYEEFGNPALLLRCPSCGHVEELAHD